MGTFLSQLALSWHEHVSGEVGDVSLSVVVTIYMRVCESVCAQPNMLGNLRAGTCKRVSTMSVGRMIRVAT